jgi:hypothetical protein
MTGLMRKSRLLLPLLALALTACAAMEVTSGRVTLSDSGSSAGIAFSSRDRAIVSYFDYHHRYNPKRLPPGLAKRQQLPPGLVKRDVLPKGLQGEPLPADLERRLHPLPDVYVRLVVGSDVVLMNRNTRVVMDIYRDVVR